ncbi:Rok-like winged helix domain-containing protein [Bacillus swezeyi]|uniref:Rok-like winged helix domain-containing protein n=1 Tax=Bacillus swezeyi TaxID=1925020 RepID=UPI003B96856E
MYKTRSVLLQREVALKILRENQNGIKGIELQKRLANNTSTSISNMTTKTVSRSKEAISRIQFG